jgi:adenylate cyclase, class 2
VTEIELKARIRDPGVVEARVASFARFMRRFDKSDQYWHGQGWRSERGTKGFRLRTDGGKAIVTFKQKNYRDGMEINRETEFEVSDPEAFGALASRLDCEPYYRKHKSGSAYEHDGCTIELVSVEGLGSFIEIERLIEGEKPEQVARAQALVRSVLAKAGVPECDIEARGYSELILGASN